MDAESGCCEIDELDDARIEDTVHCQLCQSSMCCGDNDCLIIEREQRRHTRKCVQNYLGCGKSCYCDMYERHVETMVLCADCAGLVSKEFDKHLREMGVCEHGIREGDWCPDCNREYKMARIDPENNTAIGY